VTVTVRTFAHRPFARLLTGTALVVLATTACAGDPAGPDASPTPGSTVADGDGVLGTAAPTSPDPTDPARTGPTATGTPPGGPVPASWRTCTNPEEGYSVSYPGDWHTATLDGRFACSLFHPEPFTILPAAEFPRVALSVGPMGTTVREYRESVVDPEFYAVVLMEDVTVFGRPAVRFEVVSVGAALDPVGTRRYGYIIDDGRGGAFTVHTEALPDEPRYEEWKAVVDTARDSIRFLP
jgi:hypothetical protein